MIVNCDVKSVDFWREVWTNSHRSGQRRPIRSQAEMNDRWNKRAARYGSHAEGSREERFKAVMEMLKLEGALKEGMEVLDIGAGTGAYAIPLAALASRVVALDPAVEMTRILMKRAAEQNLTNIFPLNKGWEEVDLEAEGMVKAFDLVFASMTPGVRNYETLEKMIQASRGFCFYSSFAGKRTNQAYSDLWKKIFGEELNDFRGDTIYPFNLLYAMGYKPTIKFLRADWEQDDPVDAAVDELEQYFWQYTDITPSIKQIIRDYVEEKSVNRIFHQENKVNIGVMVWKV